MTVAETPDLRRLTVARCDQLLKVYIPWLHAKSSTTRGCAQRAVEGLLDERKAALAREHA